MVFFFSCGWLSMIFVFSFVLKYLVVKGIVEKLENFFGYGKLFDYRGWVSSLLYKFEFFDGEMMEVFI